MLKSSNAGLNQDKFGGISGVGKLGVQTQTQTQKNENSNRLRPRRIPVQRRHYFNASIARAHGARFWYPFT